MTLSELQAQAVLPVMNRGTFTRNDVIEALLRVNTPIEELETTADEMLSARELAGQIKPRIGGKGWRSVK